MIEPSLCQRVRPSASLAHTQDATIRNRHIDSARGGGPTRRGRHMRQQEFVQCLEDNVEALDEHGVGPCEKENPLSISWSPEPGTVRVRTPSCLRRNRP